MRCEVEMAAATKPRAVVPIEPSATQTMNGARQTRPITSSIVGLRRRGFQSPRRASLPAILEEWFPSHKGSVRAVCHRGSLFRKPSCSRCRYRSHGTCSIARAGLSPKGSRTELTWLGGAQSYDSPAHLHEDKSDPSQGQTHIRRREHPWPLSFHHTWGDGVQKHRI